MNVLQFKQIVSLIYIIEEIDLTKLGKYELNARNFVERDVIRTTVHPATRIIRYIILVPWETG